MPDTGTVKTKLKKGKRNEQEQVENNISDCDSGRSIVYGLRAARKRGWLNFLEDRKGHDRRYAINATKIKKELGWEPLDVLTNYKID